MTGKTPLQIVDYKSCKTFEELVEKIDEYMFTIMKGINGTN